MLLVPGIELAVRPSHLYRNRIADKGCSVIIRRGGFVNFSFVRFFSSTELELSNISRASGSVALITSTEMNNNSYHIWNDSQGMPNCTVSQHSNSKMILIHKLHLFGNLYA